MGTRSYIALQIEEDEYLTIFCHYNGYPDDTGERVTLDNGEVKRRFLP